MTKPRGLDISHWNGKYTPKENAPYPVSFVIQKLTEGNFRDVAYDQLKQSIRPIPIRGGYHYWRGQYPWAVQVDTFLEAFTPDYHFWAWDIEKQSNYSGAALLNKPFPGFVEMLPLALKRVAAESKRPGVIYTGAGVWMDWLRPIWAELLKYDLWVAHYWKYPDPEKNANYFTISGAETMRRDWKIWQFTAKGLGKEYGTQSLDVDQNVFNGTLEELRAWAIPEQIPVPVVCRKCGQVIRPKCSECDQELPG